MVDLLVPLPMDTIDSHTEAKQRANMATPLMEIKNSVVLKKAKESVIPTTEICRDGNDLAFYQDKNGAAIMNVKTKDVYECPQDGKCFRLPMTDDKTLNRHMVIVAEIDKERRRRPAKN